MRNALSTCLASLCLLGCGGGGDAGPTPLKHHFDDMHIAAVEMGDKQPVMQTQNDYSIAKMEHAKADADYNESGTKLDVAKNERQQALLAEKSAKTEKKAADDSNDMNRVNSSAAEMRRAELARKAADEKVAYLEAQRKYLKKFVRYTEENMYAKEAKFELSKARVAKQKNIKPKGFELSVYERQYKDRSERAQRARAVADRERSKANEKKKKWQSLAGAAEKKTGGDTTGGDTTEGGGDGGGS